MKFCALENLKLAKLKLSILWVKSANKLKILKRGLLLSPGENDNAFLFKLMDIFSAPLGVAWIHAPAQCQELLHTSYLWSVLLLKWR